MNEIYPEQKIEKRSWLYKLSWRLILVHLLGTFVLVIAARQFAALYDIEFVQIFDTHNFNDALRIFSEEENFGERMFMFYFWHRLSGLIGILTAFLISLTLTIWKKKFWLNSVIVLIIAFLLNRYGLFKIPWVNGLFAFGGLFEKPGIEFRFIANGILFLLIGLVIFFSRWTNRFAYPGNRLTVQSE